MPRTFIADESKLVRKDPAITPFEKQFPECVARAKRLDPAAEFLLEGETPGSSLWLIEGWAALYKQMEDGRRQIIDVLIALDLITPPHDHDQPSPFGAIALTEAKIAYAPCGRIEALRCQDPEFFEQLESLERRAQSRRGDRMLRLGQASAEEIVAFFLLELDIRLRADEPDPGGPDHYLLPISQKVIGEVVGLTNIHVCRTLARLADHGLIDHEGEWVTVHNTERLARFCGVDLEDFKRQTFSD